MSRHFHSCHVHHTNNSRDQIRLLRYFEEDEAIECSAVYAHKHEVISLAACPHDASLIASVFNTAPRLRAAVWRMPELPGLGDAADAPTADDGDSSSAAPRDMTLLADLPAAGDDDGSDVRSVLWRPVRDGANAMSLISVETSAVRLWSLHEGGSGPSALSAADRVLETGDASFIGGAAWDPHHVNEVAVAADSSVHCWDLRSGQRARGIEGVVPIGSVVRDISYNPNKPWHLATAGDDFRAKVWDLRKATRPVKILDGHTHWCEACAVCERRAFLRQINAYLQLNRWYAFKGNATQPAHSASLNAGRRGWHSTLSTTSSCFLEAAMRA